MSSCSNRSVRWRQMLDSCRKVISKIQRPSVIDVDRCLRTINNTSKVRFPKQILCSGAPKICCITCTQPTTLFNRLGSLPIDQQRRFIQISAISSWFFWTTMTCLKASLDEWMVFWGCQIFQTEPIDEKTWQLLKAKLFSGLVATLGRWTCPWAPTGKHLIIFGIPVSAWEKPCCDISFVFLTGHASINGLISYDMQTLKNHTYYRSL